MMINLIPYVSLILLFLAYPIFFMTQLPYVLNVGMTSISFGGGAMAIMIFRLDRKMKF